MESNPPARRRAMQYLAAYWLFLVVLTHWPNPWPNQGEPKHLDKLVHFTLYGVLAGLAAAALTRRGSHANVRPMLGVLLLAVVFGLVDETTQPYTGRDFDWWDWLADGLGAAAGLLLLSAWHRRPA